MAGQDAGGGVLRSVGLTNKSYLLERRIGKGGQGDVFSAICQADPQTATSQPEEQTSQPEERVAIKLVRLPAGNKERLAMVQKEIRISNLLSAHPHIMALRDLVVTPPDPRTGDWHVGIVMDLGKFSMQHIVNKALTGPLRELCVRWWFQQLILAVEHCHEKEVGQRDVKPGNILMFGKNMQIRLADFGLSKQLDISGAKTPAGTSIYMAPEILSDAYRRYDAKKADVWSCGVVLFQLLFPLEFNTIMDSLKGTYNTRYTQWLQQLPDSGAVMDRTEARSQPAISLLRLMLQEDPEKRITLSDIRQQPWFVGAGEQPTAAEMEDMQRVARGAPPLFDEARLNSALLRIQELLN